MEKLRIGLTQRVEVVTSYGERRDCLDQEWSILLRQLDFIPIPLPNQIGNVEEHLESLRLDGLIFTGGNDLQVNAGGTNLAPERDQFESELIEISSSTGLRLLGVCRGLQMLVTHYGGRTRKFAGHVATRHALSVLPKNHEYGLSAFSLGDVNSFHDFCVFQKDLPECLRILAVAKDETVEAVRHENNNQIAIMWHPEREPHDKRNLELINSFFRAEIL